MLSLSQPSAHAFVPSKVDAEAALAKATHLAIGAHPDDLEFMAGHAIVSGYRKPGQGFAGVTVAAGAEDPAMEKTRRLEQERAAEKGEYLAVLSLAHASRELKEGRRAPLERDLAEVFRVARPQIVYTHNPFDKHDTHVAVCQSVVAAVRALPADRRPQKLYGCEVWRGLDWLPDALKVRLDVSSGGDLLTELMRVYESQLKGKAYDVATKGRKQANATYFDAYSDDDMKLCEYAVDLTPLLLDPQRTLESLAGEYLTSFRQDVLDRLNRTARKA